MLKRKITILQIFSIEMIVVSVLNTVYLAQQKGWCNISEKHLQICNHEIAAEKVVGGRFGVEDAF